MSESGGLDFQFKPNMYYPIEMLDNQFNSNVEYGNIKRRSPRNVAGFRKNIVEDKIKGAYSFNVNKLRT